MLKSYQARFIPLFRRSLKESKPVWSLAVPVMIGQVGHMMFAFADNLMVGRLGPENLGAASISNSIFFVVMLLGMGLSFALTPIASAAVGAGKSETSVNVLRQGLIIGVPFALLTAGFLYVFSDYVYLLNQPPEVTALTSSYLKILAYSAVPFMIFQIYRQYIEGLGFTRPGMTIIWIALGVNILGNYVMIYGHFGFPKLGLDGAGWATFISRLAMMVMIILFYDTAKRFKNNSPLFSSFKPDLTVIRNIIKVGIPSGFQYIFEGGAFLFGAIMVGWLGTIPLAAHQIALNLASMTYLAATGISTAAAIRIGFFYGQHDHEQIRFIGFQCSILVAVFMTVAGVVFILFSSLLPYLYIDNQSVIQIAVWLIIIAAFFQISDGVQAVGLGILRGVQDTRVPTMITFAAYWLFGIPIGYVLAFWTDWGAYGIWTGFLLGLTASAAALIVRFNHVSKIC